MTNALGGAVGTFVIGTRTVALVGAGAMFASLGGYAPVLRWPLQDLRRRDASGA